MPIVEKSNTKFIAIKCENGLYVRNESSYGSPVCSSERLNGGKHEMLPTWHDKWYLMKGADEITSYEKKVIGKRVNFRWELRDKDDNPLGLPEVISQEDSHEKEYDYDWYIGEECEHYKYHSLYERVSDQLPDTWDDAECQVDYRGTVSVDDVDNFQDMKVTLHRENVRFDEKNTHEVDLSSIVRYDELEELLTPPLAIHNRPCRLTSHQTYKIIRSYVKENMNHTYAEITSDYDFCFTVKKRIPIKPYILKREIKKSNGRSYARPRFSTKEITHKSVEIFEMTHQQRGYQGYTIIKGFEADNLQDMATQIRVFLDELMERINEPLVECEHCNGFGHIINDKKVTRES